MKFFATLFTAAFLLIATSSFSQKSVFENASLAKAGDGSPCVQLTWKKGAENTAYYLVERSVDGKEFKQIALVFTGEDASFVDYKFRDKTYPAAGNAVYYRIVLVDGQKEISYLPVRRVELSGSETSQMLLEESYSENTRK